VFSSKTGSHVTDFQEICSQIYNALPLKLSISVRDLMRIMIWHCQVRCDTPCGADLTGRPCHKKFKSWLTVWLVAVRLSTSTIFTHALIGAGNEKKPLCHSSISRRSCTRRLLFASPSIGACAVKDNKNRRAAVMMMMAAYFLTIPPFKCGRIEFLNYHILNLPKEVLLKVNVLQFHEGTAFVVCFVLENIKALLCL